VSDYIAGNAWSIGYIDAGHGQALDMEEIDLKNADGNYQTSADANFADTVGAVLDTLDDGHAADSSWQAAATSDPCFKRLV